MKFLDQAKIYLRSGDGGDGVGMGKDHTLFALREGEVTYATKQKGRVYVSVKPS